MAKSVSDNPRKKKNVPRRRRLKFIDEGEHYGVYNRKKEFLGQVSFDDEWKCWIWMQNETIGMSWDCLQEVINFMKELKKK